MGRPRQWSGTIILKVADDFRERIDTVLIAGEDRSAFIRAAVEREIARRAKRQNRLPQG